jgi:hypothetical protein
LFLHVVISGSGFTPREKRFALLRAKPVPIFWATYSRPVRAAALQS